MITLSPNHKTAGILAPLFALRGKHDLGIGDVGALREFINWCADHGFGIVQILPINETGPDNSPYNAISATALDPTTIEITPERLPDLPKADYQRLIANREPLRNGSVNYTEVKALKQSLLTAAFQCFDANARANSSQAKRFRAFCRTHSDWLEDYTLFRTLMEEFSSEMWNSWPAHARTARAARDWMRTVPPGQKRHFKLRMRYFAYVQWIAFTQWAELKTNCAARGVALMGDVPIGVSYYSADVFAHPEIFDLAWSCGAPPERNFTSDPFTTRWGQNWGVPLYRWDAMRADDFAWWRRRVRTVRAVFDLFRVDHILGFYRIFAFPWRPQANAEYLDLSEEAARAKTGGELPRFIARDDSTEENKRLNRSEGEALLRVLLAEVGEHRLIGEDLGVVPDYVRPSLSSIGIAGFKIPQWEPGTDGRPLPGDQYPALSVTTYATHDHDPLRTMWNRWAEAITSPNSDVAGHARWELQRLMDWAGMGRQANAAPFDDSIREALLHGLFRSNSWIALVMITDLFGLSERFNVPGAVADSNWSHRLNGTVSDWNADATLQEKMKRITTQLHETGRSA